ncbi:MAG TPA: type IV pilus secretin PilQ [Xanthomonadaceae bacterium]|jgi:type IV pilus assembly protein PilQ
MSAIKVIRQINRSRATALGLGVWLLSSAFPAFASNVLQQVTHAPGAKGGVDITLQFANPIGDAQVFTTDSPPRIAVDLPDTHNGLAGKKVLIGDGSASALSAAEANGRTRVMVDLFRQAPYQSRIEGNRLILTVADSGAKLKGPAMANTMDPSRRVAGALSVSNVDFRRAPNGAGRIVLRFTGDGAAADMRVEGSRVMVDVGNAMIPSNLSKHLDVSDFATPVQSIDSREQAGGTRLVINTGGNIDASAYQTGNEYVIEINPKKAEGGAVADANSVSTGFGKKTYSGKPATFNFQDVPVRTVLQLIAEESGLNVVAADTVTGNVTLRLINVPWDQALDIVLRAKGLDQRRDGGVVWVAPQRELASYEQSLEDARIAIEQRQATVVEYIPINYGSAEDITRLLTDEAKSNSSGGGGGQTQRGFLSPRGSVSFDKRSNTLLLTDVPKKVDEIKKLVSILDRPVDQVLIEARVVIADEEFARDLGAQLGITGVHQGANSLTSYCGTVTCSANNIANLTGSTTGSDPGEISRIVPTDLNVNLPVTTPAGSIAFSILNGGHVLDLALSAMQSEGRGEVVSNPRVITSNQKEADIQQGDEIGYVTISGGAAGGAQTANVQFKDVVLELKVTPTITHDNRVYMALDIKKDELKDFINVPGFGNVPEITKREVTTAALVDSGQTVVIGGVYEFSNRDDMTKVPFLADLPGLGMLFRSKNHSTTKAELLVFVTPKILEVKQRN